jgi:ABC-type transport system substrate-binding protein
VRRTDGDRERPNDGDKPTVTIAHGGGCDSVTPIPQGDSETICASYEPLVRKPLFAPDAPIVPGLAISWSVRPGNKVITLTLRRNARFSDGAPVAAAAVKAFVDFYASKNPVGTYTVPPIRSVDMLGKWGVRIAFKSPSPYLAYSVWTMSFIASPKAVADAKAHTNSPAWGRKTFGAGPYVLDPSQTVLADHCTLVPNKYYYDSRRSGGGRSWSGRSPIRTRCSPR